ncbi:SH3 and multiple ankyrin repeat domains protein 1-like [Cyanistes caeruleus]|uniref:SH3 and multiple ankyrin repeat domains protein 1-like n=1 Tax=Cyanistes caeruleus TaxID=156563 RepID=UPI000CDB9FD8|nr:SH3 and multiple ankyrin repeat domains protein 1-like [Cyanistes caeruleus]
MMVFRIGIPDLHQTKCLRFDPGAAVWAAKQQLLCALTEGLHDGLNYGLFQPAAAGRDAKFLDEERPLRDYPQSFDQGVPYLEVGVVTEGVVPGGAWTPFGVEFMRENLG